MRKNFFIVISLKTILMFAILFPLHLTLDTLAQEPQQKKVAIKPQEIITMELFSFKSGGDQWYFSLFRSESFGVLKKEEEIKNPKNTISLEEVLKRLESIPDASFIIWRNLESEEPPAEIKKKINELSSSKRFRLIQIPYRRIEPPKESSKEETKDKK